MAPILRKPSAAPDLAVPKGHIEAATAFGFSGGQTFRRILFPAMMRYALPGIGNNWQVILKATALVSLLGLEDVVKATQLAGKAPGSRSTSPSSAA